MATLEQRSTAESLVKSSFTKLDFLGPAMNEGTGQCANELLSARSGCEVGNTALHAELRLGTSLLLSYSQPGRDTARGFG